MKKIIIAMFNYVPGYKKTTEYVSKDLKKLLIFSRESLQIYPSEKFTINLKEEECDNNKNYVKFNNKMNSNNLNQSLKHYSSDKQKKCEKNMLLNNKEMTYDKKDMNISAQEADINQHCNQNVTIFNNINKYNNINSNNNISNNNNSNNYYNYSDSNILKNQQSIISQARPNLSIFEKNNNDFSNKSNENDLVRSKDEEVLNSKSNNNIDNTNLHQEQSYGKDNNKITNLYNTINNNIIINQENGILSSNDTTGNHLLQSNNSQNHICVCEIYNHFSLKYIEEINKLNTNIKDLIDIINSKSNK